MSPNPYEAPSIGMASPAYSSWAATFRRQCYYCLAIALSSFGLAAANNGLLMAYYSTYESYFCVELALVCVSLLAALAAAVAVVCERVARRSEPTQPPG
jgi:hypothetical protein